jgi:hypothetical protein
MNAPLQIIEVKPLPPLIDILRMLAESAMTSWCLHPLDLDEVVDPLQHFAEKTGLVAAIGQDAVQEMIGEPFAWARGEELPVDEVSPQPLELQPRTYRTPQSTVDAFWYVVSLGNADHLERWLQDHPKDAPNLVRLLEAR